MTYKVNKQKCTSCQICINKCPGATKMGSDGKAEVVNQEKLENCGGESICPFGAIEKVGESNNETTTQEPNPIGRGRGGGQGRGFGAGKGRGKGRGQGRGRRRRR